MATRLTAAFAAALAAALLVAAVAGAALVGIYRNPMQTKSQREQAVKVNGQSCARGAVGQALRIAIGKRTGECAYRTPVIGRNLEISATERLLSETPAPLQHTAFLALSLRGEGTAPGYQLAVYPFQRKVQIRKVLPSGQVRYLAIERNVSAVAGIDKPNQLRLQAFDVGGGPEGGSCHILAFVGGKLIAETADEAAAELKGRLSGFSVGAATGANGVVASVNNLVVRVPSPFG
jgi:hypothetical protein